MFQDHADIQSLQPLFAAIMKCGGHPVIVGGFVRDQLLGRISKDIDIEVFGISAAELETLLAKFGDVKRVGKSFGVFKLRLPNIEGLRDIGEIDVSLPRRERKTSEGHTGFEIECDPDMTFVEAASRRDFTINAMGWDVGTQMLMDPHNGQADLNGRILRAVSHRFAEDPLRVLRGMRFAAQCEFSVFDSGTLELCRELKGEFATLSVHRIWGEWYGWARKAVKPSLGLEFLRKTGWIEFFPEIAALVGVPQDPTWHPEGDVYVHTGLCLDAMVTILNREDIRGEERAKLMLTILAHDFGKPSTTSFHPRKQKWTAYGHCEAGVQPCATFLERIGAPDRYTPFCQPLIGEHLTYINKPTPKNVQRLADRLGDHATIKDLLIVIEADHSGRAPLPQFQLPENAQRLRELATQERVTTVRPRPLIQGRHLIEAGYTPGPQFGDLIRGLFELQLDQRFATVEEGLRFVPEIQSKLEDSNVADTDN